MIVRIGVAVAVVLVGALCLLTSRCGVAPSAASADQALEASSSSSLKEVVIVGDQGQRVAERVRVDDTQVQVLDADDRRPLAGAVAELLPLGARRTTGVLGRWHADSRGLIKMDAPDPEGSNLVRFTHGGYVPQVTSGDCPAQILLHRSESLRVDVRWPNGRPAVAVPVSAFQRQASAISLDDSDEGDVSPGPDPVAAFHVSESGRGGPAVFDQLEPGTYGIGVAGADYVAVEFTEDEVVIGDEPATRHGVVAPVFCCVVAAGAGGLIDARLLDVQGATLGRGADPGLGAIRRALERRYPACKVVVCSARHPAAQLTATLAVTIDGWATVEVSHPMVPPSKSHRIAVVGQEPAVFGSLLVDLKSPSGVSVEGVEVSVASARGGEHLFVGVPAESGKSVRLPAGTYTVGVWNPLFQVSRQKVVVNANQESTLDIELPKEVRCLRVQVSCQGEAPRYARLQLRGKGWAGSEFGTYEPGAAICCGFVGSVTLRVEVYGYDSTEHEFNVGSEGGVQDVMVLVK